MTRGRDDGPAAGGVVRRLGAHRYAADGFAVIRSPLLPLAAFREWNEAAPADDPPASRRSALRAYLARVYARPEVREALYLGSPDLADRLDDFLADPQTVDPGVELALVRYFQRMACRATPFGLFAACSLVRIGRGQRLEFAGEGGLRRVTRLDMDYLESLMAAAAADPSIRSRLRFEPNDSLYRAAGRLRYVESRVRETGRSHHLVSVTPDAYLEVALAAAELGATPRRIAAAVVDHDPEIDMAEAEAYVDELVASGLLVSELRLPVTGDEPLPTLIEQLEPHAAAADYVAGLSDARDVLAACDRNGAGNSPTVYDELATRLAVLPVDVERKRLIQVDLWRETAPDAVLSERIVTEILRGVEMLHRLTPPAGEDALATFRADFNERYEGREVPLTEVLDEDIGVGFMRSGQPAAGGSPLLAKLPLPGRPTESKITQRSLDTMMLERLADCLAQGGDEIEVTSEDLDRHAVPSPPALPEAFSIMAVVLGRPTDEPGRDQELRIQFKGLSGPSGARLLGRFCHLDAGLTQAVSDHLRREEALRPEAVFAEVIHLPEGRIGNILFRPRLREHEIPYLGRSSCPPDTKIPLQDLMVSVRGDRIVLRSRRLGREIIPRLTSAHNYVGRATGIYRFLGLLQNQAADVHLRWDWGALQAAPFLPRVRWGRVILSPARWRVDPREIDAIYEHTDPDERMAAAQAWARRRGLPQWVEAAESDNTLSADLENPLSVDALLDLLHRHRGGILEEMQPRDTAHLAATGPNGAYRHEILIPFVRLPQTRPAQDSAARDHTPAAAPASPRHARIKRSFPPGDEWIFAKLYCGEAAADDVLQAAVEPLIRRLATDGICDDWFFIRYADPRWHLRLRVHGDPSRLTAEALPALRSACAPLLEDTRLWRLDLGTYEREVERYGGPKGIAVCEGLFRHDSEAVVRILADATGDEGGEARWLLTLLGTARLMEDLGLATREALSACEAMRDGYLREFPGGKALKKQLGLLYREKRDLLAWLLRDEGDAPQGILGAQLRAGRKHLLRRSEAWEPAMARLRDLAAGGELTSGLQDLSGSLAHMHANRMIRSAARAHELVINDFLCRQYRTLLARARA